MADINQVITLGIGTPGDIEHFILFGLNMNVPGIRYVNLFLRKFASLTLWDRP